MSKRTQALLRQVRARIALALIQRRVGSYSTSVLSPRNPTQTVTATPANPTGTTSLVGVMMGLAIAITPKTTGRIAILIQGQIGNNTTADGATAQIVTGTGTAPANGAAATGTLQGQPQTWTSLTGVLTDVMHLSVVVVNLVVGTAAWIDLNLKAVTGGTASLTGLNVSVWEF